MENETKVCPTGHVMNKDGVCERDGYKGEAEVSNEESRLNDEARAEANNVEAPVESAPEAPVEASEPKAEETAPEAPAAEVEAPVDAAPAEEAPAPEAVV